MCIRYGWCSNYRIPQNKKYFIFTFVMWEFLVRFRETLISKDILSPILKRALKTLQMTLFVHKWYSNNLNGHCNKRDLLIKYLQDYVFFGFISYNLCSGKKITKEVIIIIRKFYSCDKLSVFKCFKINKINTF